MISKKCVSLIKSACVKPGRRKWGLGIPIHIKYQLILINIEYYITLVLNRTLYINYIDCLLILMFWYNHGTLLKYIIRIHCNYSMNRQSCNLKIPDSVSPLANCSL